MCASQKDEMCKAFTELLSIMCCCQNKKPRERLWPRLSVPGILCGQSWTSILSVWITFSILFVGAFGVDYFADFQDSRLVHARGCPDPQPIANAYRWITSGQVEYECVESYNMTEGIGNLICESDGTWLGQLPTCDLYCGRAPQSPGTVWPPIIDNEAMVTFNPDMVVAEALYNCKSQLTDTDLNQDNKVVCDRGNGYWKSPANIFCKNDSYLPLESWPDETSSHDENSTSMFDLTNATYHDDSLLEYLAYDCYEMSDTVAFSELVMPFLPRGRDFELTSLELSLQTTHSNLECVEKDSNVVGLNYIGTTNVTRLNVSCQAWADSTPHDHQFTSADMFADANFDDVKNYCRNPNDNYGYLDKPWCFTTDPGKEWDYCDIPACHQYKLNVIMVNATDGGDNQKCGEIEFYTSELQKNWTVQCIQSPTGPFGRELKITANVSKPLFLCELRPHGIQYISGCGEPPHQRGWALVNFDGYSLGDQANYTCAKGYYYKRGSKTAKCIRSRLWSGPSLECSDETNLALDGTPLRDNKVTTCATLIQGSTTDIRLSNMMEIRDVVLTLDGVENAPEVNAVIQDGTDRRLYDVTSTDEGYYFRSPFHPVADHLKITAVASDLTICEVAVFGRNSSETLECTLQSSEAADYKGNLSVSNDGHECIPWTEHSRIADFQFADGDSSYVQNFCRNPYDSKKKALYSGSRPICFYRDDKGSMKKDYCEVLLCDAGCRNDQAGANYQGGLDYVGIDSTNSSNSCERWDGGEHRFTRKVDFAGGNANHNKCRNPGRSQERAWCITNSGSLPVQYQYCNIPECPKTAEVQWTINIDLNNQTGVDELYHQYSTHFRECICTDKEHISYVQPDLAEKLAQGFCAIYPGTHKSLMCHHKPPSAENSLYGDGAMWSRLFIKCPSNPETIQPTLITEAPTLAVESSTDKPTSGVESSSEDTVTANDTSTHPAPTTEVEISSVTTTGQETATGTTPPAETSTDLTTDGNSCPVGCSVACINVTLYDAEAKEKMQELLEDNQRRMFVDKASLSKQKRKKTSASDERPSSQATGAVAISILVSVFVFLMTGDIIAVVTYMYILVKDCR